MAKWFTSSLVAALLAASLLSAAGCARTAVVIGDGPGYKAQNKGGPPPWAPAHGYRAKHKYRYYPGAQVYFDVGRNLYFYSSGGQWRVGASLPAMSVGLGEYVVLEMGTDKPYEHHGDVMRKYPPGHGKKNGKPKK
jgi:hypothetical protein